MCTRFYADMSPELRPYVEAANRAPLKERMVSVLGKPLKTEGEIRPTDMYPAIATSPSGKKLMYPMVWGYRVSGLDRPVVNARIETAAKKGLWSDGWKSHRCIIPASYYFEWEHLKRPDGKVKTGDKYAIQPKGSNLIFLAGVYRIEEERGLKFPVFSILTREPSEEIRFIHDRMPLILPKDAVKAWIRPDRNPKEIMSSALTEMVFEKA